jgi:Sec-independent protein translocase protein TatA
MNQPHAMVAAGDEGRGTAAERGQGASLDRVGGRNRDEQHKVEKVAGRAAAALLEFQRAVVQLQTSWQEVCALSIQEQQQGQQQQEERHGEQQEGGALQEVKSHFQHHVQVSLQQLQGTVMQDLASSSRGDNIPAGKRGVTRGAEKQQERQGHLEYYA